MDLQAIEPVPRKRHSDHHKAATGETAAAIHLPNHQPVQTADLRYLPLRGKSLFDFQEEIRPENLCPSNLVSSFESLEIQRRLCKGLLRELQERQLAGFVLSLDERFLPEILLQIQRDPRREMAFEIPSVFPRASLRKAEDRQAKGRPRLHLHFLFESRAAGDAKRLTLFRNVRL